MPYELYYRPSFNRSTKRLGSEQKKVVGLILEVLDVYYSTGCNLSEAQRKSSNFFYKKLRGPYYEAGVEKNIRVIIHKVTQSNVNAAKGQALYDKGRYEEATAPLESAIKIRPEHGRAHYYLATM